MIRQPSGATSIRAIDLNADLGEHDGDGFARDIALLDVATSANIACGEHAGSEKVMKRTVELAYERGVRIGAHPGYPDREGFGRRETGLSLDSVIDSYSLQLERMAHVCDSVGAALSYVKPHGALYNRAARDAELAAKLAATTASFDSSMTVLTLPGCQLDIASHANGLNVAREAFIDRGYMPDGSLVPRTEQGAMIEDSTAAAERAVTMVRDRVVTAIDGSLVELEADSLCVHGDGAHALETIRGARAALEAAGFTVRPFVT